MPFTRFTTFTRHAVVAGACVFAVAVAGVFTSNLSAGNDRAEARLQVREDAQLIRVELERDLHSISQIARGVAAAIAHDVNIDQETFSRIAEQVVAGGSSDGGLPEVFNIAASSDLVVRYVYPYERNQSVVGLDYRDIPEQRTVVEDVKANGRLVLAGPVDLVQGGRAMIARIPVADLHSDRVWGVVSVVAGLEAVFGDAAQLAAEAGLDFAIHRENGAAPIYGDAGVSAADPLDFSVPVPGSETWRLSMVPSAGWPTGASDAPLIWAIYIALGSLVYAVFAMLDRAAEARRGAERQLRLAIDGIADGFAFYDAQDRLVICNEPYRCFYPRSAQKMIPGQSFRDIIKYGIEQGEYLDAIGREAEWLEQRMAAHARADRSVVQRLADGRWLKVFERRLEDGSTVGFRVDITELMEARQAAEAGSRAKSLFLDRMSHELRTPLAILMGYLAFLEQPGKFAAYKALRESADPEALAAFEAEITSNAGRIRKSGKQLMAMVDRILDVSAVERRSDDNDPEELSLDDLLFEASRPIEWSGDARPGLRMPKATGIGVRVDRATMTNALSAIFRHGNDAFTAGEVCISVEESADTVDLFIELRGTRAASVLPAKVFEGSFEALDADRGSEMSLDLAIAERLIAQSLGGFTYRRVAEDLDRVEISLPRAQSKFVHDTAA